MERRRFAIALDLLLAVVLALGGGALGRRGVAQGIQPTPPSPGQEFVPGDGTAIPGLDHKGPAPQAGADLGAALEDPAAGGTLDPAALQQTDWFADVMAYIESSEYHFSAQEGGAWAAPNRAQDLRILLDSGGGLSVSPRGGRSGDGAPEGEPAAWTASLRFSGHGYAASTEAAGPGIRPAGAPESVTAEGGRIEVRYGPDLVEWFVNSADGVEQGFTLASPPPGAGQGSLVLELALSGNLVPRIAGADAVELAVAGTDALLVYAGLVAYDAGGLPLAASFDLPAGGGLRIVLEDGGASYPITIDPVLTWPWAADPADQANAWLGLAVSTAGDVNDDGYDDVLVGAPGYDNGAADEGRAYLYHGSPAGPVSALNQGPGWQVGGQASAYFGLSVAGAGDVNGDGYDEVLIGAPYFDTGPYDEGRAFLFFGGQTGLTPVAWTADPTDQVGAAFGAAVSTAGDVNGDGYDDMLVGAPEFSEHGAVYLYLGGPGNPAPADGWPAVGEYASARFGQAVASAGDVNGDGYGDMLVGAPQRSTYFINEGAAYLFLGGAPAPDSTYDWRASPTNQTDAFFGASLAAAGNVDRDRLRTVRLLSQGFESGLMPPSGWEKRSLGDSPNQWMIVYAGSYPWAVHSGNYAAWVSYNGQYAQDEWLVSPEISIPVGIEQPTLEFWALSDTSFPGATVTVYATDADGTPIATLWDMIDNETWTTFAYRQVSIDLSVVAGSPFRLAWRYHGLDGESFGLDDILVYGYTPAPAAGYPDVVIGAPGYSGQAAGEGRAYVYSGNPSTGLDLHPYWWADPTNQAAAGFGSSVSALDPSTGTGVLAGSPKYDNGAYWDEGRLYVFPATADDGVLGEEWYCTSQATNTADGRFGQVVAPAGDTDGDGTAEILAGGYRNNSAGYIAQEGYLFQYEVNLGNYPVCQLSFVAGLHPTDQDDSGFGLSASAGDFNGDGYGDVIAGAHTFDGASADEGRVYAYYGSPHGLLPPAAETWYVDPADQEGALFGASLSAAGDVNGDGYSDIVIGAHGFDQPAAADAGAAFVYLGSPSGMSWKPAWTTSATGQAGAQFGRSAAGAGDVNGDGYADVIIGAPGYSGAAAETGRIAVYHGSFAGLGENPEWVLDAPSPDQAYCRWGWSVGTAGDLNGDGYSDVIIGTPYYDPAGYPDAGVAFVYYGSADGVTPPQNGPGWQGYYAESGASYGYAVGTAGDVNGDGYSDILIGVPYADNSALGVVDAGGALVYYGSAGGPGNWDSPDFAWYEDQPAASAGAALSTAGDVDGDGYDDLIVGAYGAADLVKDSVPVAEGLAYLFRGAPGGLYTTPAWTAGPANQEGARFGAAVAGAGDVNGDGFADVVVGAPYFDRRPSAQEDEGRFYLYLGSSAGLSADASPAWAADPADGDLSGAGHAVGTAGDVNGDGFADVFVSAVNTLHGTCGAGVYVYHGSATGMPPGNSPSWHATGTTGHSEECFGYSAGAAGDVNDDGYDDLVVGAPNYDDNADGNHSDGAVYVYFGSIGGLSATVDWLKLDPSGSGAGAYFGYAVAGAGDVDRDGYADIAVGAPRYSGGGYYEEGRVYVFYGNAAGFDDPPWSDDRYNQTSASLGSTVAAAGDVNGDGYADVIAGVPGYYSGNFKAAAVLYQGAAGGMVNTPLWSWYGSPTGSRQVTAGLAGDVNGDGYGDLLLGSPGFGGGTGRAYLYYGSGSGPAPYTSPSWATSPSSEGGTYGANFGWSMSTAGDVNGDGYADIVVGAPWLDVQHGDEGRAYLYYGSASGPGADPDWIADPAEQDGAWFGFSLGFAGDVNGDGFSDIIAGSPGCDASFSDDGRAYLFYGRPGGLGLTPVTRASPQPHSYAHFGFSVAGGGDVNGDGYSDVLVGAYKFDPGTGAEGRVFAFHGTPQGLAQYSAWSTAPINNPNAMLGRSLGTAGDVNGDGYADIIIGAPGYSSETTVEVGRVYIYHGSPAGLSTDPNWVLDGPFANQNNSLWGWSLGTAGDVNGDGYSDVLIGTPFCDPAGYPDSGTAWLYYGSAAGVTPPQDGAAWEGYYMEANAGFGYAVGTAGDVNADGYADIVIGVPNANNAALNLAGAGAALVYYGSAGGLALWDSPDWAWYADQAFALAGRAASTAGDVNGDGYSDIVVGAFAYDTTLADDEGRAYVFHGSASGLHNAPAWYADPADQEAASFGSTVATAGDVNGDGYSDIVVGAPHYLHEDGGRAYLYYGSAGGLTGSGLGSGQAMPDWQAGDASQPSAGFASSIACAGDVDGDGYSDVVIGAPDFDGDGIDWGMIYLYYGNGGSHPNSAPRQRRFDDSQPIGPQGLTALITQAVGTYRLDLLGRSPFGRGSVRLQWEVKRLDEPFDGTGLVAPDSWNESLVGGSPLTGMGSGADLGGNYKWRVRVVGRSPLPWTGRWFTPSFNNRTEADFRVPLTVRHPVSNTGWQPLGGTPNKANVEEPGTMDEIAATVHLDGRQPEATPGMIDRWYELSGTGSGWRVEICLHYEDAETGGRAEEEFRLCRWAGTEWECKERTANSSTLRNLVCGGDVTAFSDWVISDATPTGVVMLSFTARPDPAAGAIVVAWETASELDILGFNLHRSESGEPGTYAQLNVELIPSQVPPGSPFGAAYEWVDTSALPGQVYYYLLEAVDLNGSGVCYGPVNALLPLAGGYLVHLPMVQGNR
ncbi:MAG TPA: FG-GAP-like repeat-containing protein [Anaerolineae bacterium]|nr:FG-GAP-like repeat-containing protein [Anaerolineae bacterium]